MVFLFPIWIAFAGGRTEKNGFQPYDDNLPSVTESSTATDEIPTGKKTSFLFPPEPAGRQVHDRGEEVLRAYAKAYPDRISGVEYYEGEWTIIVYGERFYYAEGRLLPADLREKAGEYNPMPFYNYERDLPPWTEPTEEESARMKEQEALRQERPPVKRSSHFNDALWRTRNRDESWEHIKQIRFLSHPVQVHYSILVALSLVEEQILRTAKVNSAVNKWVSSINSIDGWNWRNIASAESRSFHSYGAAIDILPKSLGGLETYWLWTAKSFPEWWAIPYTKRLHPPDEVVKIFESFGFVWGGKWRYYDTMHFEYRPEIFVLGGIELKDLKDLR